MVNHHLILFLAALTTFHVSSNSAPPPLSTTATEFLQTHNEARASVGVEPLTWNEQLANITSELVLYQRDKMSCQLANLTALNNGANQFMERRTKYTPRMVVENWVTEKQFYNHSDNSCVPNHQCDSYTQVVWRKSVELGCAQASCSKQGPSLSICFYNPPGNYVGESPY
ncbi:STS14 protein-like [Trifolium pratense]|uniref:STS14 protein-like n=1 Tax=Trifolium pratense TaxID=57577 RepID=UPI001E690837|nr:STS14 protein-like [Trifolium pratense]